MAVSAPPAPIRWNEDCTSIVILDQTRLPQEEREVELTDVEGIEEAIVNLRVRGAPLIGITAAMGAAALARRAAAAGSDDLRGLVEGWLARLERARPTAVNLHWAVSRMRAAAAASRGSSADMAQALVAEAEAIRAEDEAMCRRIGEHAVELLHDGATALTHCNAGALATGGIGTALAPLYLAHERGWRLRVFADETRPLLQGSRLTAWELARAGIDVTVISDGMAGVLMARDRPDVVMVGADRIAANGDVANKVGTYGLAVLAAHHRVPFYVLAPTSTLDLGCPTGADIPIEVRDPDEIRRGFGSLTAPADVAVWSPAFDVTPAELVTAIVTDTGIWRSPYPDSLRRAAGES